MARQNSEMWETGFKTHQSEQHQFGAQYSVINFFVSTHPPTTSLVNFKHKITTTANYTDGFGTGYMSHNKEMCLQGKRL